jgi:hypothetical protein
MGTNIQRNEKSGIIKLEKFACESQKNGVVCHKTTSELRAKTKTRNQLIMKRRL